MQLRWVHPLAGDDGAALLLVAAVLVTAARNPRAAATWAAEAGESPAAAVGGGVLDAEAEAPPAATVVGVSAEALRLPAGPNAEALRLAVDGALVVDVELDSLNLREGVRTRGGVRVTAACPAAEEPGAPLRRVSADAGSADPTAPVGAESSGMPVAFTHSSDRS